ncbi:hypothetical protein OHAE_322 [Ochrobactrum soli]|uniref:Uncharacterized protein n=1 Tax=Ochrobactrum soli TaxID=2448455 RepID=A0A2P9HK44_9HYPH|nr:hypothetical protein OHAE_322 [[Ochrobactrum] soli]
MSARYLTDNPLVALLVVANHAAETGSKRAEICSLAPFVLKPVTVEPSGMLTLLAPGPERNVAVDIVKRLVLRLIQGTEILNPAFRG